MKIFIKIKIVLILSFCKALSLQAEAQKKPWTVLIYIAARNDLHPFSKINMRQMLEVGSSPYLNIVVQLDEPGKKGVQRFYIEKNNPVPVYHNPQNSNSGDPQNLISFVQWGLQNYPADNVCLILWDHGTGSSLDPYLSRSIDPVELFSLQNSSYQLNEEDYFYAPSPFLEERNFTEQRGHCFDDTYKSYINNQGSAYAFKAINEIMQGEKLAITVFDACLMADLPTASLLKNYSKYLVASEEVVPGTGLQYRLVFLPFQERALSPEEFAHHITHVYAQTYRPFSNDFTLSAIDLAFIEKIEHNVHTLSQQLIECLGAQKDKSVKDALQISCNRRLCTTFDEPSYKDLHHFYSNLLKNHQLFKFHDEIKGFELTRAVQKTLEEGMALIKEAVISNYVGKNLAHAGGISIYLPDRRIHSSFTKTTFAANNAWYLFLKLFLAP